MADIFINKGADVYLGYNESTAYCNSAAYNYFNYMLNGASHEKAFDLLPDYLKDETTSHKAALIDIINPNSEYGNPQSLFICDTHSVPQTDQDVAEELNNYGKITLQGNTSVYNLRKSGLLYGFRWGTEPNVDKQQEYQQVYSDDVHSFVDAVGQAYFSAEINPGIGPERTIYYRAFTYDGIHYNWGEEKKFNLEKLVELELSVGSFCMNVGESVTIDITSGNGSYAIFNENSKVTAFKIDGERLKIDAVGAGESTIIVTDQKTNHKVSFDVTVWANLSIGIIGNMDLEVGESTKVEITSGNGDYTIESDAPNKATASIIGEFVTVQALAPGHATITMTDTKTGQSVSFEVNISDQTLPEIPLEAVDLGLKSGTLWANRNLGATRPEDYGDHYSWGETDVKEKYDWSTYKYCDGTSNCINIGRDISGSEYDVAREKWGFPWKMPNSFQFTELMSSCTYEWTTVNDVNGYMFTGPNGNSIFMPATSQVVIDGEYYDIGKEGKYWSSSRSSTHDYLACYFSLSGKDVSWSNYTGRYSGFSVRPVMIDPRQLVPDLVLSTYEPHEMSVTTTSTFIILSGSGSYTVESSNEAVAMVELRDNNVDVRGVTPGKVNITVTDTKSGQKGIVQFVITESDAPTKVPAEAVDLGLPSGTLWASYNLGAVSPEDYGWYYAWGETTARSSFEWESYQYYNSSAGYINIGQDISGTDYDVARKQWGDSWRMPSSSQFKELISNCSVEETTVNGVYGRRFTGKNGNSIFLPAGGSFFNGLQYENSCGYYWSSTLTKNSNGNADILFFRYDKELMIANHGRSNGATVRPVINAGGLPIPDLVLERTGPFSFKTRQRLYNYIVSGSGSYTATSSKEAVATAIIDDVVNVETSERRKCVCIEAVSVGTSTITVTDTESGQKVLFEVTVTQNVDLLKLSTYSLGLRVGEAEDVAIVSSSGASYLVAVDNACVATFSLDKPNTITVRAIAVGTCKVSVSDSETGEYAVVEVTVVKAGDMPSAGAVDLGLPSGTLWASFNVGATKPEEVGGYYAWGETETKERYSWSNYIHCDGTKETCHDIGADIAGTEYDVAHVKWGGDWTMPTKSQINELIHNCTSQWTTLNGVNGCLITGPNMHTIFLPAGGYGVGSQIYKPGIYGLYKGSTLCEGDLAESWCLDTDEKSFVRYGLWNYYGHNVRPVISLKK